ncbi:site-specific integrase [Amycolatopsis sp. EV170708-02-1]|uniref:site-specific integrase n=1 Tax=Amycolatopsis sp. EV170708-02-1 TaxID=2919322 RepID=UPI001F0BD6FB|nr:site-specific integrase [Amycolatopsis sp. EV170708-02-1]UMP05569.1 site-specific integrase [Amycolatopsis sp. EV170708-02-1]
MARVEVRVGRMGFDLRTGQLRLAHASVLFRWVLRARNGHEAGAVVVARVGDRGHERFGLAADAERCGRAGGRPDECDDGDEQALQGGVLVGGDDADAGLGWTEVYDKAAEIEINTQLTEVEYEVEEGDPKSEASTRRVPIDDEGKRLLREHRARQRRERLRVGPAWVDSGRVWTQPDGSALRPSWIGDEFERHCRAAGLPPIRLHDLRHVAATLMLQAGIDLKVVQEHPSWVVTRDTYTSVLPELARSAAEATVAVVPRRKTPGHPTGTPEVSVTPTGTHALGR